MGACFCDEAGIEIAAADAPYRGEAQSCEAGAPSETDRALLLADAERLEDLDHARGMRPAVCDPAARYFQGRTVRAGVPENLAEQSHAGHRRSRRPRRTADLGVRVRRYPAVSRPQNREVLSARRALPRCG